MKYLGVDYGTKKIGIALSNKEGTIAFPKKIIPYSKKIVQDIIDVIHSESVSTVIIGKSLDFQGKENTLQTHIKSCIQNLKKAHPDIKIIEQDERGSSVAARSHLYGKGNIENERWTGKQNAQKRQAQDAQAAAVILQRYLDKKNRA